MAATDVEHVAGEWLAKAKLLNERAEVCLGGGKCLLLAWVTIPVLGTGSVKYTRTVTL